MDNPLVSFQIKKLSHDYFLELLLEKKIDVMVYLVSGIKLQGKITSFCDKTLFLTKDKVTQMVYFQVISTIMPSHTLDLIIETDETLNIKEIK